MQTNIYDLICNETNLMNNCEDDDMKKVENIKKEVDKIIKSSNEICNNGKKRRKYKKPSAEELDYDRLERRRESNKIAARRSRLRRKKYIEELEYENRFLGENIKLLISMIEKKCNSVNINSNNVYNIGNDYIMSSSETKVDNIEFGYRDD